MRLSSQVRGAMEIAVFIQNIQEERAEVALYIFSNQTSATINATMNKEGNRMGLAERFQQTDRALEEVPTWPDVSVKIYANWETNLMENIML